jgi:hypothetical protein
MPIDEELTIVHGVPLVSDEGRVKQSVEIQAADWKQ